jgi:hypothetical protein
VTNLAERSASLKDNQFAARHGGDSARQAHPFTVDIRRVVV